MGNTPNHQPTDAFQPKIDLHTATLDKLQAERQAMRELPLKERLSLGALAHRAALYVRIGRQRDMINEYERERSEAGGY